MTRTPLTTATQLLCVAAITDVAHAAILSQSAAGKGSDNKKQELQAVRAEDIEDPLALLHRRDDSSRAAAFTVATGTAATPKPPYHHAADPDVDAAPAAASAATSKTQAIPLSLSAFGDMDADLLGMMTGARGTLLPVLPAPPQQRRRQVKSGKNGPPPPTPGPSKKSLKSSKTNRPTPSPVTPPTSAPNLGYKPPETDDDEDLVRPFFRFLVFNK